MKKSLLFLSLFTALTMASCGESTDTSKIALDYGYDYKNDIVVIDELEIGYSSLVNLIDNQESFVLLIFHNRTCDCWEDFSPLAVQFMNKYNLRFYAFDNALLEGENNYGIYRGTDAMPGICFFRRGTLIRQSIYGKIDVNHRKFFKYYEDLEKYMFDNIYLPKMYYLDRESLDEKISSDEEFNLYVARTGCNDCLAANGVLLDWSDNNKETTIQNNLYIFDLKPYHPGRPDDPGYDEKYPIYIAIKTEYKLSEEGNASFGYDAGYVPTFQRWKNGDVIDMITILNDSAVGEDVKTQSSYFTEARVNASPMLRNTTYIFQGREIGADELDERGRFTRDAQLKQQTPILKLYLSTYVK